MPTRLTTSACIDTRLGSKVSVVRYIGGGGQGDVYEVIYNGEHKALKWYSTEGFRDRNSFVRNLLDNISKGAPTPAFLWPLDMTDFFEGGFGYVMDLRPDGYYEVNDFLLGRQIAPGQTLSFPSYRRAVDACMGIVSAFRILHNLGYVYQDINSKNFFIEPASGKVLICDNDNVVPNGTDTGMKGTWGFMAPEIVHGGHPTELSDRHAMAVLVFLLLFKVHPLEGLMTYDTVFSESERTRIYGDEPLFVFDAEDHSNALRADTHAATIDLWEQMPAYLRELFQRTFSQEALHDGSRRPLDAEWALALARLRSEIHPCSCGGSELVISEGMPATCELCGRTIAPRLMIDLGPQAGYAVPALFDTRIYACQTRIADPVHALDPQGWVLQSADDPDVVGLRNLSHEAWVARTGDGRSLRVVPGDVAVLEAGMELIGPRRFRLRCVEAHERSDA